MPKQISPDHHQWDNMKRNGREVAAMAKDASKYGMSVNLKGKVVSYLRIALNDGISVSGAMQPGRQPTKSDVTSWATYTAGNVISMTSDQRRAKRFSDFGYAVAVAQKSAFTLGQLVAEGQDFLSGTGKNPQTAEELIAHVPSRYSQVWVGLCMEHVRQSRSGRLMYLDERSYPLAKDPSHSVWLPVHGVVAEDKRSIDDVQKSDLCEDLVSHGAFSALSKQGFFDVVGTNSRGMRLTILSQSALDLYKRYNDMRTLNIFHPLKRGGFPTPLSGIEPDSGVFS
jgi:hypothetical protein